MRRKVAHGDVRHAVGDAFRAFQPDQPRAQNQHVFIFRTGVSQRFCAFFIHKGKIGNTVQPADRRDKRPGTGGDQQFVIRNGRAVLRHDLLFLRVDALHAAPQQCAHVVFFIKIRRTVAHALFIRFAA